MTATILELPRTKTLHIADNLELPLDFVTEASALLAQRGVGKSYAGMVIAEEIMTNRLPVCVVDPLGVWWGLRSSADGASPGYPITIIGGEHGDVPLEETGGKIIGEFVAESQVPIVIDLDGLRKAPQRRFMLDFLGELYHLNTEPLLVIFDEVDLWAPQKPQQDRDGIGPKLLGMMEDFVRRGRRKGLGSLLISQRSAVVNKDVLNQIGTLFVMRNVAPTDSNAIKEWLQNHADAPTLQEIMGSLAELGIGDAWVYSPAFMSVLKRIHIRKRRTYDSSATPKVGSVIKEPKKLATVDLDLLRTRMAETIERQKENDPKELRRRITQLERELKQRSVETVAKEKIVEIKVPAIDEASAMRFLDALSTFELTADFMAQLRSLTSDISAQLQSALNQPVPAPRPQASPAHVNVPRETPRPATSPRRPLPPQTEGEETLSTGARNLLNALVAHQPMSMNRSQLGVLSGYSHKSGSFGQNMAALRRLGYLEGNDTDLRPTDEGIQAADTEPATGGSPIEMWMNALPAAGVKTILQALIDAYPEAVTREQLGELTGYSHTSGSFGQALAILARNALMTRLPDGRMRANDTLFP